MEQRSQRCFLDMQHCLTFNHLCWSVVSKLSMISDCFEREETLPGVQMSVTESSWLLNSINSLSSRVQLVRPASERAYHTRQMSFSNGCTPTNSYRFILIWSPWTRVLQPQRWKRQCPWVISVRKILQKYITKSWGLGYNCIYNRDMIGEIFSEGLLKRIRDF